MEDRLDLARGQRSLWTNRLGQATGLCLALVIMAHPAVTDRGSVAISTGLVILIAFSWLVARNRRSGSVVPSPASWLAGVWLLVLVGSAA